MKLVKEMQLGDVRMLGLARLVPGSTGGWVGRENIKTYFLAYSLGGAVKGGIILHDGGIRWSRRK